MTEAEFKATDPEQFQGAVLALWWDFQGNWARAHEVAQDGDDANSAWVHAYLHRKEGDEGNAAYWYRRAGRRMATGNLETERLLILETVLVRR